MGIRPDTQLPDEKDYSLPWLDLWAALSYTVKDGVLQLPDKVIGGTIWPPRSLVRGSMIHTDLLGDGIICSITPRDIYALTIILFRRQDRVFYHRIMLGAIASLSPQALEYTEACHNFEERQTYMLEHTCPLLQIHRIQPVGNLENFRAIEGPGYVSEVFIDTA